LFWALGQTPGRKTSLNALSCYRSRYSILNFYCHGIRIKRSSLWLREESGEEAAGCCEGEPEAGDGTVAGDVDQVGAEGGSKAAKNGGR